jgi:hypothetical protein
VTRTLYLCLHYRYALFYILRMLPLTDFDDLGLKR